MTTKVWITEEYGYREWLWIHPGDIDDVVADWKAGRIPTCVHVYGVEPLCEVLDAAQKQWDLSEEEQQRQLDALWEPQTGDFAGTCQLWDPKLAHWQKLERDVLDADGKPLYNENDPFLQGAIELHTRLTQHDELCREHGVVVTAHCHQWDDTRLMAAGVCYPAWWKPSPDEMGLDEEA